MEPEDFMAGIAYEPMASEMRSGAEREPLVGGGEPENILGGESFKWDLVTDLDHFFSRLYHYYCNKGFWCIVTQWAMELLTLGFTIVFSGFLILFVNWPWLLQAKCGIQAAEAGHEPCDLIREGLLKHPLVPMTFLKAMALVYLAMFSAFWAFCFARFFLQLRELLEVREFCHARLGVGEKELQTMSWPDLVDRVVRFQSRQRLCITKELSAHDIVSRIMRKENYTIGMLNKNVLALEMPTWVPGAAPLPGFSGSQKRRRRRGRTRHLVLTKTLEWSLNWCILHHMFDKNFAVRRDFTNDPEKLKRRLRMVGFGMAIVSPFLVVFMLMYFFMRNAEQFYHQPGTVGSRRWSNLAKWRLREFNELDHLFQRRLNASYQHAVAYVKQFPSPIISMVAKFVSFVTGACAAVLLGVALLDESLLEAQLFERNLFWYAAIFGTILAVSRSLITEEYTIFDPEAVMQYTARYTHYMPKHWRGKANTDVVRAEFESLFQFKFVLFFEEMASIFITPFLLWFYVPKCVDNILRFVQDFTTHVEGVGHVCSLSAFDFAHHGNSKYGSPCDAAKDRRSAQGKMEKSFLSFVSNYPTWEPPPNGQKMLGMLSTFRTRHEPASSALPLARSALQNSAPFYPPRNAMSHHFNGSYMGANSRHGGDMNFGHRLPVPSGREQHVDPAAESHLGASALLATTGANPEEASQLYWLDRYYEAARSTGSGIELDPLSKDSNVEGETAAGVTRADGRFEGDDRPMETRIMITNDRETDRPNSQALNANNSHAPISPLLRQNVRTARSPHLDARKPLSESELDQMLVNQALQRNVLRGRGVDFGVASVREEPEEEDAEDALESDQELFRQAQQDSRRDSSDIPWPTFGSLQQEGAGRNDPTGVTTIRFGSSQRNSRFGGSSRGPWGLVSGLESQQGIQPRPFARLQETFGASSVLTNPEGRRSRGRSWAGSLDGSQRRGETGRQRGSSRGSWKVEGPVGAFDDDDFGSQSHRGSQRPGLWDEDGSPEVGEAPGNDRRRSERRSFS